jgi:hypothetical protein
MTEHLKNYQCLYLRVDRRYQFRESNLVVFFGILNALNHKNELNRIWDVYSNSYMSGYMWETMPYLGLAFEF